MFPCKVGMCVFHTGEGTIIILHKKSCQPFHSQDLISNSPYSLPYNTYDFSLEKLVLDQLMIH